MKVCGTGSCVAVWQPPGKMMDGSISWVMAIPIGIKLLVPSWLFILSDVKVNGVSMDPCMFGICKCTIHTGQFHNTGPVTPILKILERCGGKTV